MRTTIAVTGGAGFIGGNLVPLLEADGWDRVLIVDQRPFTGRCSSSAIESMSPEAFEHSFESELIHLDALVHLGAITDTACNDTALLRACNVDCSIRLARLAATRDVPFLYASSASVYGATTSPHGGRVEAPLNPYAASKLAVDRSLAPLMKSARASCVGLRFFNAYGPGEAHKGVMASIVDQAVRQIEATGRIRLFDRCPDAPDGRIRRDWISVEDAVDVIRFFLYGPPRHGTFDVGTGQATTFEHVAGVVIDAMATGTIESIPFPDHLRGRYQYETVADLTALRSAGYDRSFETVEDAVPRTVDAIRTRAATSTVAHG